MSELQETLNTVNQPNGGYQAPQLIEYGRVEELTQDSIPGGGGGGSVVIP